MRPSRAGPAPAARDADRFGRDDLVLLAVPREGTHLDPRRVEVAQVARRVRAGVPCSTASPPASGRLAVRPPCRVERGGRMPRALLRPLSFVFVGLVLASAWAGESLVLATTFPDWTLVTEGERRTEVMAVAQPLSQPHRYGCRTPEVFVRTDVTAIEAAVPLVLPFLRDGLHEEVVDEAEGRRLSVLAGQGMMFDRMLVFLALDDGMWLLVC